MRTYKFRGKRIDNGEWVYGYYVKLPHPLTAFLKDYIVISGFDDKRESGYQDFILVNPETVGQFTGLYDKNGKEIYEGDIYRHGDSIIKVVWYEYGFVAYEEKTDEYTCLNKSHQKYYEIVGSIHD